MKSAVLAFPGSNCDRDAQMAITQITGKPTPMVWHKETTLPEGLDVLVIPGGFSYGDYLRCGAIAARAPIIDAVKSFAEAGGYIIGVCNGFQILCEIGLLPGTLLRNGKLKFVCKPQPITPQNTTSVFTKNITTDSITIPVAHHDGNYFADETTLDGLEQADQIAFKYLENPNGAARDIAGVLSANHRVLGMMPHPERAVGGTETGRDGLSILQGIYA